ncbi:MAG: hypothetical protein RJR35_05350 [Thermoanaerobacterales bacterium]|nr:hypothetical protein [Thermoanaerobacterales bacterium]
MSTPQIKFQQLLRELFQFDCADLDFGIYRIMNFKRAIIERFISEDLPRLVNDELNKGALAAQSQAMQELDAARKKVLEALGEDALDADGNLAEKYRDTRAGREYLVAQERAKIRKGTRGAGDGYLQPSLFPFSAATGRTATSFPSAVTPKRNATPSPTMVRKSIFTGPTTTSITSRPVSTSQIIHGRLPMA